MKNFCIALGLALTWIATVFCPQVQAQAPAEYPDVPRDHWAYNAINRISQAGMVEGDLDGNYLGNRLLSRQEFSVALSRRLGPPPLRVDNSPPAPPVGLNLKTQTALRREDIKPTLPFADVPPGHWAYDAVRAVYWTGIMEGNLEGRFQGDKPMTRYEFAAAMERLNQVIAGVPDPKP